MQYKNEEVTKFIKRIRLSLTPYYDILENYHLNNFTYDIYAHSHTLTSKYVLSKKAKLWEVETNDHLFVAYTSLLTLNFVEYHLSYLKNNVITSNTIDRNHMFSYLTVILVCPSVKDDILDKIRNAKYRKNFSFGFRGWFDLRLALVEVDKKRITTNRKASALLQLLEENLKLG